MEVVNCKKHGEQNLVLSCQHVASYSISEIYLVPEENGEGATVWCSICEDARIKDKGWYDYADSIANWKIICSACLSEIINKSDKIHEFGGLRS